MFSADPVTCSCVANGLPQISDGVVSDKNIPGGTAMNGAIIEGVGSDGKSMYYPAEYGNTCKSWDQLTENECKEEYPPAYCLQNWCFVAYECGKQDTQKTWRFPGSDLYYSYEACGSFDPVMANKCTGHDAEKSCLAEQRSTSHPAGGQPCAWSEKVGDKELKEYEQICQPASCQCTGDHLINTDPVDGQYYGSKCRAWDKEKCEGWSKEPGANMGIWCCQSWCFVDASCPSAQPSSTEPGLFWSHAACADSPETIRTCPWTEPIGWQGAPAILSEDTRALLKEMKKAPKPKPKDNKSFSWAIGTPWNRNLWVVFVLPVAVLIIILVLLIYFCDCCKRRGVFA